MTTREFFGDWYKCINPNKLNNVLSKVRPLYNQYIIYPHFKDVFKAFRLCPYRNLKVIFIGMDPYNDGSATGLAFANRKEVNKISPSLQVIKKCLEENYTPVRECFDTTLESWAKQGVLLLNSSLTVEYGKPGSHSMLWREFISSFLTGVSLWQTGIIYVLMGEQAKAYKPYIGPFNDIIECSHPAFYARNHTSMPNIFKEIDDLTWDKNKIKIIWI